MKVKVTLPENIEDITLATFQKYAKLLKREDLSDEDFNKRKVEIFTNLKYHDLDNVSFKDYEDLLKQIDIALSVDVPFKDRFTLNDIEFGFIPNFDKITTKEFVDLSLYPLDEIENYHKLMAILFRPIKNKELSFFKRWFFKNKTIEYSIQDYNGTDAYAEMMKQTPMNIVNGALVFFYNLMKELQASTQRYTMQELLKARQQVTSLKSGDGIPA